MDNSMQIHDLVWFLITGGLAGWIASVLVEGSGLGILGDVVVGVAGAFLGGYCAYRLQITLIGYWEILGISIFGSVLLLSIFRIFTPARKTTD
jgi:uncharacterized membrane protein YeaQ/YmgE (transglycosylase-associated protein family)